MGVVGVGVIGAGNQKFKDNQANVVYDKPQEMSEFLTGIEPIPI